MELKEYKKMIDNIVSDKAITDLIQIRKVFNRAKDTSLNTKARIEHLIDALALATSYQERLTYIKISLRRVEAQLDKELSVCKANAMKDATFVKSSTKNEKDYFIQAATSKVNRVREYLSSYQDNVQYALDYVTSAAFNIKTVMGTLKEYFNAEGAV